jgi:hypothetical protein
VIKLEADSGIKCHPVPFENEMSLSMWIKVDRVTDDKQGQIMSIFEMPDTMYLGALIPALN